MKLLLVSSIGHFDQLLVDGENLKSFQRISVNSDHQTLFTKQSTKSSQKISLPIRRLCHLVVASNESRRCSSTWQSQPTIIHTSQVVVYKTFATRFDTEILRTSGIVHRKQFWISNKSSTSVGRECSNSKSSNLLTAREIDLFRCKRMSKELVLSLMFEI